MLDWQGKIKITAFDAKNNIVQEDVIYNTITTAGKNLLASCIRDNTVDAEIKFVALGSDNTSPTTSDTSLGTEIFRKSVTSKVASGTGATTTTCYIAPDEAVSQIEEIGFFSGSSASSTTDSGTLYARVLYSRNKTAVESLQIERVDTLT